MTSTKAITLTPKLLRQLYPRSMEGASAVIFEFESVIDVVYSDGRRRKFTFRSSQDLFKQLTKLEAQHR